MEAWKTELMAILDGLLGSPATRTEFLVLSAVVMLTLIVGLRIASGVFGLKMNAWWRVAGVVLVTFAVALAAVAAVRIFMLNASSSPGLRLGLQIGAAVIMVLAIGIPLQMLLQRGNYLESLSSFAATIIISALITAGAHATYQVVVSGSAQMKRAAEKNKEAISETEAPSR